MSSVSPGNPADGLAPDRVARGWLQRGLRINWYFRQTLSIFPGDWSQKWPLSVAGDALLLRLLDGERGSSASFFMAFVGKEALLWSTLWEYKLLWMEESSDSLFGAPLFWQPEGRCSGGRLKRRNHHCLYKYFLLRLENCGEIISKLAKPNSLNFSAYY